MRRLVLASGSPRRLDLLVSLGLKFSVIASEVDETVLSGIDPAQFVVQLAKEKALAVAGTLAGTPDSGACVLGADTVVVLDHEIIGKPKDRQDALAMLARLSGCWHEVFTGVALVDLPGLSAATGYEATRVLFRAIEKAEMAAYADSGEPYDKAGAYALQGMGSAFVEKIEGCFTNVIGLPMPLTVRLLRQAGVEVLGLP